MAEAPHGLYSDSSPHFASPSSRDGARRLTVTLRALASDGIQEAWVRTAPDGEEEHAPLRATADGAFVRFSATLPVRGPALRYRFVVRRGRRLYHVHQGGVSTRPPTDATDWVWLDQALPLDWLQGTTVYQIFPDRFCRGDPTLWDRQESYTYWGQSPVLRPWGSKPLGFRSGGHMDFTGGDLAGIEQRIGYLTDLGVGALYLNPVFHAPSNHRYDGQDYERIDPRLGTNEDFARLVSALHDAGIRVILDGVFNHVGCAHRWFNREGYYPEAGAWQSPEVPEAEYFLFDEHPERYDCWNGIAALPKLDYRSQRLRDAIYAGDDAVTRRWLRPPYGMDGWRFDVANMLARNGPVQLQREVWRELRAALKATRPDAYLLGEHYFDATDLLDGTMLDGVMAYHTFYFPLLRWLTGQEPRPPAGMKGPAPLDYDSADLARDLIAAQAQLPFQIAQGQLNLMGSHDTSRILSLLDGDRSRVRVAAALLLTWPGVPSLYYGDEIGLTGLGDPACRGCMVWEEERWDQETRRFLRRLVRLRREHAPLARGGALVLHAAGDLLVFARIWGPEVLVVAINRGSTALRRQTVNLSALGVDAGHAHDLLGGRGAPLRAGQARLDLGPRSLAVLRVEA